MSVTFPKNMQKIALIGGGALVGLIVLYKLVSGSKTVEEDDGESDTSSISSEEYPAERDKRYGSVVRDGDDKKQMFSGDDDDDEDDDEEFTIGGGGGALRKKSKTQRKRNNKSKSKSKRNRSHKKRSKGRKNKKGHN